MDVRIENSWRTALKPEFEKPYFNELAIRVRNAYKEEVTYPPPATMFAAFDSCPLPQVKVVILGQDPYHGPKQANGLAFSVANDIPFPPSLQNIFKEIRSDIGTPYPNNGDLTRWAVQGVLLLNSTLTVRAGQAGAHQNFGWEMFTDAVISTISKERTHVVFMLWGAFAQSKRPLIDESKHLILTAPHPSPFSAHRGFFGSRHFSQCNTYLVEHGITPITW